MDSKTELVQENKTEKKSKPVLWLLGFFAICGAIFFVLGYQVYKIDPYFHFRAPNTEEYYYELSSERNQNDGILRNFTYNGLIIGSSMAQNFKTSEFDEIFGVSSVKTTFSDGSFKETGDRLRTALASNKDLKVVVRSLDMDSFFLDYDDMGDMSDDTYPDYLYDDNKLNDYKYLLSKDVLFKKIYEILYTQHYKKHNPGISSFDTYSNWMEQFWGKFGISSIVQDPEDLVNFGVIPLTLSDSGILKIKRNITRNFLEIAEEYPNVDFYVFIPPYSALWWNTNLINVSFVNQIQAEQYIIELMLPYENIHLFSFNDFYNVTTDLNNYKDQEHYGEWVNSAILRWMKEGTGQLTSDNYLDYIKEEYYFYSTFDYTTLYGQLDYEDDAEAETYLLIQYFPELL